MFLNEFVQFISVYVRTTHTTAILMVFSEKVEVYFEIILVIFYYNQLTICQLRCLSQVQMVRIYVPILNPWSHQNAEI